jgi:GxxExxY protein
MTRNILDIVGQQKNIIFKEECFDIQGAAFEVYRELGCGFLESVYQECLAKEFRNHNIPFVSQPELKIIYKGEPIEQIYKPDFICYNKIVIELKAAKELAPEHKVQTFNYLKASGLKLGMLINFGHYPKVEIVRIAL